MTEKLKKRLNEYYDIDMDKHGGIVKKQMARMKLSFVERQTKAAHEMELPVAGGSRYGL